jgi:hypothetical protein
VGFGYERATYEPRIGELFRLSPADGEPFDAVLSACDDAVPGFSLLFHGPSEPWSPQGTFRVEHADLGSEELFLVPLGPDERGMRYEAVIA